MVVQVISLGITTPDADQLGTVTIQNNSPTHTIRLKMTEWWAGDYMYRLVPPPSSNPTGYPTTETINFTVPPNTTKVITNIYLYRWFHRHPYNGDWASLYVEADGQTVPFEVRVDTIDYATWRANQRFSGF